MIDYAEENIPAKQSSSGQDTRIQSQDGFKEWPPRSEEAEGKRQEKTYTSSLLNQYRLRREEHLRNPSEFRMVYEGGYRFDGRLVSIFVMPNTFGYHRLGITASRKLSHSAVKRNRAKRLIRESFRLHRNELNTLQGRYDWVFNSKRALLRVKVQEALEELREVITRVRKSEENQSKL